MNQWCSKLHLICGPPQKKTDVVLEIGTGTGYQTAIISHLCQKIYTIEIFKKLFDQAKFNIKKLKITNVIYALGNGLNIWKEKKTVGCGRYFASMS